MMRQLFILCLLASTLAPASDQMDITIVKSVPPRWILRVEGGPLWQTRNTFRLPGNSGSEVRLADFKSGPFLAARVYAQWNFTEHHSLRALWAPLAYSVDYTPTQALSIGGKTFNAGTPVSTRYKFNSYRLTYAYHFDPVGPFHFRLGATAKIRDANISTSDGTQSTEDPNLGFVPLVHLGARWVIDPTWFADLDADALAAPQGRAEDVALRFGYVMQNWEAAIGYRFLEGGANNDRVFTFAFLHYVFASAAVAF